LIHTICIVSGEVVTLTRDCEKKPIVLNGVRTDKHLTKMYTSCNTDRCNSGNGKRGKCKVDHSLWIYKET